ncbi:peptidyl-prolyl cis-trans isomerase PpiD [Hydrogenimonas sp.]|nr:peptidyl-prolyl cis-trans isomerase PpiD [Hydrogenimonas sp.]
MISWMQKHRKYLVVTIWISTIAFVGAGFVGWGTYQYGSKSNSVALVGDIPITMTQFQNAYSNIYEQYNRTLGGTLDEATAKQLGLKQQALQSLIYQALIKNFAAEHGVTVSDAEVQQAILSIPAFQKEGSFDKNTYLSMLRNMRMKPKVFEASLKDELLIKKTLRLLDMGTAPLETNAFGSALFISDKIRYRVFNAEDVKVKADEAALKSYWKKHKTEYMTPTRYKLSLLWVEPSSQTPDETEIEEYYKSNRTDFTDSEGKILPLEEARERVVAALRLKASKKAAQLAYIDLKKERKAPQESVTLDAGDPRFSAETWKDIEEAAAHTTLKPKVENGKYVIIRVDDVVLPRPKTFEEAYADVKRDYISKKRRELLLKLAESYSENLQDGTVSDFLTRDSVDKLKPLSNDEAAAFLQKLFSTKKAHGAILLDNKAVSYEILEQKLLNKKKLEENIEFVKENTGKMKENLLQSSLIKRLQQQYPVEIYLKESE